MKIAIAGFGIEGKANYTYWNTPENQLVIVDEHDIPESDLPLDASVITGEGAFGRLQGFDMVVRTAGLAPRKIVTDGQVWSATNEFFAHCRAPIIGVTGSKGKGTTSSLIASILRASGKTVHLVGNIGLPALDSLPAITEDDIVVYELSSFQLWDIQQAASVAVVLYIEPDHLDVHADFDDYIAAKSHIASLQTTTDRVVYCAANQWATAIARQSPGQRLPYPAPQTAHVRGEYFYYGETELCAIDALQLPGQHNLDNACAAITAVWSWVQDGATIAEGLSSFDGLPHRLKFVRELGGVRYYDDSIATTPGSAIAALAAFDAPKVLILGGSPKGADFAPLAQAIAASNTRRLVLIGSEAPRIQAALDAAGVTTYALLGSDVTMPDIVAAARAAAEPGDVVVLSPSCASFGMFANYADRGQQFIDAVQALV